MLDPSSIKSVDSDMNFDSRDRAAKTCPQKRKNYEISCLKNSLERQRILFEFGYPFLYVKGEILPTVYIYFISGTVAFSDKNHF